MVEDSDEDFAVFSRVLKRRAVGAQVSRWSRAESVLEVLAAAEPDPNAIPDVLIVDLSLPGIDGCELIRRLRRHEATAQLPIFMLSGSQRASDVQRCVEAGADACFHKSANSADLHVLVDTVITKGLQPLAPRLAGRYYSTVIVATAVGLARASFTRPITSVRGYGTLASPPFAGPSPRLSRRTPARCHHPRSSPRHGAAPGCLARAAIRHPRRP